MEHLKNTSQVAPSDKEAFNRWSKLRLDRVLVDYMLRKGFNDTAKKMAEDSEISVSFPPHLHDVAFFFLVLMKNGVDRKWWM